MKDKIRLKREFEEKLNDKIFGTVQGKFVPKSDFEKKIEWYIKEEEQDLYSSWSEELKKYFMPTTTLPKYWDMRHNPEYHEEKKGLVYKIVLMPPERYKELTIKGFPYDKDQSWGIGESNIDKLRQYMKNGSRFPMLTLDYSRGFFGQEGRHRAELMIRTGVSKVPVMVVWDADKSPPIKEVK